LFKPEILSIFEELVVVGFVFSSEIFPFEDKGRSSVLIIIVCFSASKLMLIILLDEDFCRSSVILVSIFCCEDTLLLIADLLFIDSSSFNAGKAPVIISSQGLYFTSDGIESLSSTIFEIAL